MKTLIKTSVVGNTNMEVEESIVDIIKLLKDKEKYITVTKIEHSGKQSIVCINKGRILLTKGYGT